MKRIAMPAYRLTADCIWNSFQSCDKKHIIITGDRGTGKTTLLSELFTEKQPGITSWVVSDEAVYLKENTSDETVKIGIFDSTIVEKENRMVLSEDGFLSLGIPALNRCLMSDSQWITIDEIGYLESECEEYLNVILKLLENKHVAAVIRKQNLPFFSELCSRNDVFIVDLDDPFGNIGCVIMASGFAKRFGENKLIADFNGKPLIDYVLDATENIFSRRVVVTRYKEIEKICKIRGVETIFHNLPNLNDTIRLGLDNLISSERCMFATSDQPLLRQETVASLALASRNSKECFWRTSIGNIHGSPVVFPSWSFDELMHLDSGNGGSVVIKKHPEFLRTVNVENLFELKDVDNPQQLNELEEYYLKFVLGNRA